MSAPMIFQGMPETQRDFFSVNWKCPKENCAGFMYAFAPVRGADAHVHVCSECRFQTILHEAYPKKAPAYTVITEHDGSGDGVPLCAEAYLETDTLDRARHNATHENTLRHYGRAIIAELVPCDQNGNQLSYDPALYHFGISEGKYFDYLVPESLVSFFAEYVWRNPHHYSDYVPNSDTAWEEFLKLIWVRFPDGKEHRLPDLLSE